MQKRLLLLITTAFYWMSVPGCTDQGDEKEKKIIISSDIPVSQPLAGTDELGRVLPLNEEVGDPKANRQVGIFYFLWQGDKASTTSEKYWDLTEIIPAYPEVLENFNHPNWGTTSVGGYYFWGKPLYGYYRGDDYWVHLRNMQLLTDAQVDFLIIDATNTLIYPEQSEALMQAIKDIQAQGKHAPRLVYYTNTESGKTMQNVYNTYYRQGAPHYHPSCWYRLDGKPLIIGISSEAGGKDYESFFTFRESQWPNEPVKTNGWPWIEFKRPQQVYTNAKGGKEIVNVSVAQHPDVPAGMGGSAFYGNRNNWGRSFRNGSQGNPEKDIFYGYNVQEQWDFALNEDPPFIFITGWNEWIAGRWKSPDGNPKHSFFCDQADPEYSRDIEPTRTAGLNDNYYMQMVANIRRYKGAAPHTTTSGQKTIQKLSDWNDVPLTYTDYTGDTKVRNHPGAESVPERVYTNNSGRNDLSIMKVVNDATHLYFFAQTSDAITREQGKNWMNLYINSDRNSNTGWLGYDFRVAEGNKLQVYSGGAWENLVEIDLQLDKNKMMYSIPLQYLKLSAYPDLEFKWSDNMQDETDPLDWYINGDLAPGGRFNFIYTSIK
ncbi:hypothetical protein [Gaoshiqia sp. Z1-71]|uniref:hypothetical protein n=1 Tax=Gaoshiqia hydrogeniformans TaxID=3290090 RepID=UPI003BF80C30